MSDYKIDREVLEQNSTEEIKRILRYERDDYTPEAIEIFEDILEQRGIDKNQISGRGPAGGGFDSRSGPVSDPTVTNTADAIRVLNEILADTLNGRIEPEVATAASNTVMVILRALEQELLPGCGG
jgi:hypothetical protein